MAHGVVAASRIVSSLLLVLLAAGGAVVQAQNLGSQNIEARQAIVPELAPLARLVGFCWRGDLGASGAPAVQDIHCYNSRMNGHVISDRHVVTDQPSFCGETLFHARPSAGRYVAEIAMRYYNIAGMVHDGVLTPEGADRLSFPEEVFVRDGGVRQVFKSVLRFTSDQAYDLETWEQQGGVWRQTHRVRYRRETGRDAPQQFKACR